MKRILEITERGTRLRLLDKALYIQPPEQPERTVSLDDLGSILLSTPAASVSGAALASLAAANIPVVVCDERQFPCGLFLPFAGKSDQTRVLAGQIAASLPVRKRLWQELVRAKIENQAIVLSRVGRPEAQTLATLVTRVRSGDAGNREAAAARLYWRALGLFPARRRGAANANCLFDYSYTILASLCARAICAAGLHPGIGLHHRNGRNAFCLAYDLVEPFRAAADLAVLRWISVHTGDSTLSPEAKRFLVRETLNISFIVDDRKETVTHVAEHTAIALRDALLTGETHLFRSPTLSCEDVPKCG